MLIGLSIAWACAALLLCRHHTTAAGLLAVAACFVPPVAWALVALGLYVRYVAPLRRRA